MLFQIPRREKRNSYSLTNFKFVVVIRSRSINANYNHLTVVVVLHNSDESSREKKKIVTLDVDHFPTHFFHHTILMRNSLDVVHQINLLLT
jgi:hypothetical protein